MSRGRTFALSLRQVLGMLIGAFLVGALLIGTLLLGLLAQLGVLSEEPPIKVRGGSLDIEIVSEGSEFWEEDGDDWILKSGGVNISGNYKFSIALGSHCAASGTVPAAIKKLYVSLGPADQPPVETVELSRHKKKLFKTKVKPRGNFRPVTNKPKIVTNDTDADVTVVVTPGVDAPEWRCTFPKGTFQELCIYKGDSCQ